MGRRLLKVGRRRVEEEEEEGLVSFAFVMELEMKLT